jgi:hypothetical protein
MPYKNIDDKRAARLRWNHSEKGRAYRATENPPSRRNRWAKRVERKLSVRLERKNKCEVAGIAWDDDIYDHKNRKSSENKAEWRRLVEQYKARRGCEACGESNPAVLMFTPTLSEKVGKLSGWKLLNLMGLAKIRCANCVRIMNPAKKSVKIKLCVVKARQGCSVCGDQRGAVLDFHHRERSEKTMEVSRMARKGFKSALREAAKCDVLCANCHIRHHRGNAALIAQARTA